MPLRTSAICGLGAVQRSAICPGSTCCTPLGERDLRLAFAHARLRRRCGRPARRSGRAPGRVSTTCAFGVSMRADSPGSSTRTRTRIRALRDEQRDIWRSSSRDTLRLRVAAEPKLAAAEVDFGAAVVADPEVVAGRDRIVEADRRPLVGRDPAAPGKIRRRTSATRPDASRQVVVGDARCAVPNGNAASQHRECPQPRSARLRDRSRRYRSVGSRSRQHNLLEHSHDGRSPAIVDLPRPNSPKAAHSGSRDPFCIRIGFRGHGSSRRSPRSSDTTTRRTTMRRFRPYALSPAPSRSPFRGTASAQFSRHLYLRRQPKRAGSQPVLPPGTGLFTTNPGPLWPVRRPELRVRRDAVVNQGGNDYAQGGARVTSAASGIVPPGGRGCPSRSRSTSSSPRARSTPNALYQIQGGANDILRSSRPLQAGKITQAQLQATSRRPRRSRAAGRQARAAGAQYIILQNLPDMRQDARRHRASGRPAQFTQLCRLYNSTMLGARRRATSR